MKNVIITILVMLVLGLGGYLVYDKFIEKDNNENDSGKTPTTSEEITMEEVKELVDIYLKAGDGCDSSAFQKGFTENYRVRVVLENLNSNLKKKVDCSEIYQSGEDGNYYVDDNGGYCNSDGSYLVSKSDLNDKYEHLFGEAFPNKDYNEPKPLLNYVPEEDGFVKLLTDGGCMTDGYFNRYSVKSFDKSGDTLKVYLKHYIIDDTFSDDDYYWFASESGKKLEKSDVEFTSTDIKNLVEKYDSKLTTYVATFKYVNDHYVFLNFAK